MVLPIIRARRGLLTSLAPALSIEYTGDSRTSTTSGSPSFANVDLGGEPVGSEIRHILLGIGAVYSGGSNTGLINSLTINGISATRLVTPTTSGATLTGQVWIAEVPSGLTGPVVISGAVFNRWTITPYRVVGLQSVLAHDTTFSLTGATTSIDRPEGGFIIAAAAHFATSALTFGPSLPEIYTASPGSSSRGTHAMKLPGVAETVSVSLSGGTRRYAAVSLR